ncbi:MgtC/SapB family protein [Clostridium kluyveri]|uniref:Transporter n=1 Tax=Clostridium kluyveri TaxID=1534 RepID=A0A1L5F693_CLOKL|nr:MgtC/SapB family protein [Clostridium kluyveri]APM38529.1 transporter [Clostridium kluyveri]UZQ50826.1 MgtC/SapB family protein [Clostridium kluyveri]
MTLMDFLLRVITALILGGIIGIERQYRHRMAGIHTNALVCVGSCLFVFSSFLIDTGDKTRIAAQVVTGVGFLGGGVIMRDGFNIKGLNTAATLWCTAAIGVLVSVGDLTYAFIGALVVAILNSLSAPISKRIYKVKSQQGDEEEYLYTISIKCDENEEFHIRTFLMHMLAEEKIVLRNLESDNTETPGVVFVTSKIMSMGKNDMSIEKIVSKISLSSGVLAIGWEVSQ